MGVERGPLVILLKGQRMNQTLYTELVLKPYFIPFYQEMVAKYSPTVQIQEDRAKFHFAPVAAKYKKLCMVRCLQWPPQSPDLAPIENV